MSQEATSKGSSSSSGRTLRSARRRLEEKNDAEDDNDEESEQEANKSNKKQRKKKVAENQADETDADKEDDNEFVEMGQIMKIMLTDFMCHRKFTMDFGKRLNFVTGKNGSGKSAIAVALQVCLGTSTRVTGRGSKIADFIREGSQGPAIIQVTLRNEGIDAYEYKRYGNRIIVERRISKTSSGNSYSLQDCNGKVVATDKKELQKILEKFHIQPDNPCCILTQEESKKFIQGSDEEKFQFFMKATGLLHNTEVISEVKANLDRTVIENEKAKESLGGKKAEQDNWGGIVKQMQDLITVDANINKSVVKALWCDVKEAEKAVAAAEEITLKAREEYENSSKKFDQVQTSQVDSNERFEQIEAQTTEIQAEIDTEVQSKQKENAAAMNSSTRVIATLKTDLRSASEEKNRLSSRLRNAEGELSTINAKLKRDAATGAQQDVMTKIERNNSKISAIENQLKELQQQKSVITDSKIQLNGSVSGLALEIKNKHRQLTAAISERDSMRGGAENAANLYLRRIGDGDKMVRLKQEIEKNIRQFRSPPIGPAGLFINLSEGQKKWEKALESILGGVLSAFIVENYEDEVLLKKIMRPLQCNYQVHRVNRRSRIEPHRVNDADVALSAITVTDDLVFNVLVDVIHMEGIVLAHTEKEVTARYVNRNGGQLSFKTNIAKAVTLDGVSVEYRAGSQSSITFKHQFKSLLSKDTAVATAGLEEIIQTETQNLRASKEEHEILGAQLIDVNAQCNGLDQQLMGLNNQLKQANREKQELDNKRQEIQESQNIDTSALEGEMEDLKKEIEVIDRRVVEMQGQQNDEADVLKRYKDEKCNLETRRSDLIRRMDELGAETNRIVHEAATHDKKKSQLQQDMKNKEKALAENEEEEKKKKEALEAQQRLAEERSREKLGDDWDGKPVPLDRKDTRASCEKEVRRLERERGSSKDKLKISSYTLKEVMNKFTNAKEVYKKAKTDVELCDSKIEYMSSDLKDRKCLFKTRLQKNSMEVQNQFDQYLQFNGFSGSVEFDLKKGTLQMVVQTSAVDDSTKSNDVRNLSGGERSYSAFCLLLALGHVIDTPFRVMDEYDVFLDEKARKCTLTMMQAYVNHATQKGRQYIMITPHSLSDVNPTETCRVKKMLDPIRRSAHGLQQTTMD